MPRVRLCVAYLVVEEGLRGGGLRRDEVGCKIILMQTAPKLCKQFPTASEATTWQYCSSQVSMAP